MKALRRLRRTVRLVGVGLILAALSEQLARPRSERTWTGRVGGVVPYDFRVPTPARIKRAYWNPYSGRLFSDRVLGVGWSINLHRLRELARAALSRGADGRPGKAARTAQHAARGA